MATPNLVNGYYVHPSAEISESAKIGEGTVIWNQVQVREGATIGKNCTIGKDVYIDLNVIVGNNVKIQNGVSIYYGVIIEDDVFLGPHMTFTNDKFPRAFNSDWKICPIRVKKGASIGAHATVLPGLTIGEYAMIGAGGVITKDVPSHALLTGTPARIIGFVCNCGQRLKKTQEMDNHVKMICTECCEEYEIALATYNKIIKRKK